MYTIAPLTCLIGMSLSCATTSGLEFRRTLYSRPPRRADPAGRVTFSALMAALPSDGESPFAYNRAKSGATVMSRGAPPPGQGMGGPRAVAGGARAELEAESLKPAC